MRDKSQLSGLTVPVGGGKGKKNWEQLQQESSEGGAEPRTEGVQVGDNALWAWMVVFSKSVVLTLTLETWT